jgi:dihydrofolate reductase
MATVDALVMGRKSFEAILAFDTWPYGEKPVFVLSTKPLGRAPVGLKWSGCPELRRKSCRSLLLAARRPE